MTEKASCRGQVGNREQGVVILIQDVVTKSILVVSGQKWWTHSVPANGQNAAG